MMAINAGIASIISNQSSLTTCCIIMNPTMISAGAVANEGTVRKIGEKNSESTKNAPVVSAVSPVRPPSAIPEVDSTNVVIVDVPRPAPTVVATASARRAPLMPGRWPSSSSISALEAHPISVPSVSKMSTNRKENMTTKKLTVPMMEKSILKNVGASEAGAAMMPDGIRL